MIDSRVMAFREATIPISSFSRSAFGVGFAFLQSPEGEERCLCPLFTPDETEPEECPSFRRKLFSETAPRLVRCPAGLAMALLPLVVDSGVKALLLSEGFLEGGEAHTGTNPAEGETSFAAALAAGGDDIPRLSSTQADLLIQFTTSLGTLLPLFSRNGHGDRSLLVPTETFWREVENTFSLVGVSPGIMALRDQLPTLANSSEPVLIESEEGNGRHLLASILHRLSPRRDRPLLTENLSVLPESLQERELFGPRGNGRGGLLAQARGGTVFLSGIDHLSGPAQKGLVSFLVEGGREKQGEAARLIISTDTNLGELVRRGRFRGDLQRHLSKLPVFIPPLRERPDDIPVLASHLLYRLARRDGRRPPEVESDTLAALREYPWPGNARELSCELERASAFGKDSIGLSDFSPSVRHAARPPKASMTNLRDAVGTLEIEMISRTLSETNWNKSKAARILGLSRLGLQKKIDRYGIDRRR